MRIFFIGMIVVGLVLLLAGCYSRINTKGNPVPSHAIESYSTQYNIRLRYFIQRFYDVEKDGKKYPRVAWVDPTDAMELPADTKSMMMTVVVENVDDTYIKLWRYVEHEVPGEVNTNRLHIFTGRLPSEIYQMRLSLAAGVSYKVYLEMNDKDGDLILRTLSLKYRRAE